MSRSITERCAEILMSEIYRDLMVESSATIESTSSSTKTLEDDTINVYVKSFREVSIDEVPIILAIMDVFRESKLRIYEYERITHSKEVREEVLARLVRLLASKQEPSIVVMPKALPVGLYGLLPEKTREALSKSTVVHVKVFHDNIFYLPQNPPATGVEIVAKRNSESSYARVVWLQNEAERLGVLLRRTVFLEDNPRIFSYTLSEGIAGFLEKIPVNKLAQYAVALHRCGMIGPLHELKRSENNEHYIYILNLPEEVAEEIARAASMTDSLGNLVRGILYDNMMEGAMKIFDKMLFL